MAITTFLTSSLDDQSINRFCRWNYNDGISSSNSSKTREIQTSDNAIKISTVSDDVFKKCCDTWKKLKNQSLAIGIIGTISVVVLTGLASGLVASCTVLASPLLAAVATVVTLTSLPLILGCSFLIYQGFSCYNIAKKELNEWKKTEHIQTDQYHNEQRTKALRTTENQNFIDESTLLFYLTDDEIRSKDGLLDAMKRSIPEDIDWGTKKKELIPTLQNKLTCAIRIEQLETTALVPIVLHGMKVRLKYFELDDSIDVETIKHLWNSTLNIKKSKDSHEHN
ncbi:MAG: hypothetical protein KDK72_09855 [Chlamydiia bacterium]|nr:hypothetical protein [Chlamydiia bacterium]